MTVGHSIETEFYELTFAIFSKQLGVCTMVIYFLELAGEAAPLRNERYRSTVVE
jgi:hypothetical protein